MFYWRTQIIEILIWIFAPKLKYLRSCSKIYFAANNSEKNPSENWLSTKTLEIKSVKRSLLALVKLSKKIRNTMDENDETSVLPDILNETEIFSKQKWRSAQSGQIRVNYSCFIYSNFSMSWNFTFSFLRFLCQI